METPEPIKLTIISDGTPEGTDLVEVGTGRKVAGLQGIKFFANFEGRPFLLSIEAKFTVFDNQGCTSINLDEEQARAFEASDLTEQI